MWRVCGPRLEMRDKKAQPVEALAQLKQSIVDETVSMDETDE